MNRSRAITVVLSLILVACATVIFMDQNGMLGSQNATTSPTITPTTPTTPTPTPTTPSGDSGYGGLK